MGISRHQATRSTLIRPGSRSAATQVCIVSLKPLPPSISLHACASTHSQFNPVSVVHQPVLDRVAQGRIADQRMPFIHRHLAVHPQAPILP